MVYICTYVRTHVCVYAYVQKWRDVYGGAMLVLYILSLGYVCMSVC